jgi:hypothetical protein
MRSLLLLTLFYSVVHGSAFAVGPTDPVLLSGLNVWSQNGAEAAISTWYANQPELAFQLKAKLLPVTKDLGSVIDSEVVAVQPISRRVTRYFVAVYFNRTPLWLCIDRYAADTTAYFLPLRFSTDPDRILPGYLTEFPL